MFGFYYTLAVAKKQKKKSGDLSLDFSLLCICAKLWTYATVGAQVTP